uniref:Uncharacterized protein n=1 Tax=Eutreptiella gymnastica TaxID=73025 RepID=A0A7S4CE55_9EUGL
MYRCRSPKKTAVCEPQPQHMGNPSPCANSALSKQHTTCGPTVWVGTDTGVVVVRLRLCGAGDSSSNPAGQRLEGWRAFAICVPYPALWCFLLHAFSSAGPVQGRHASGV